MHIVLNVGAWELPFMLLMFGVMLLNTSALIGLAKAETIGWATTDVNMRSCPSTGCARILVIPAGAGVSVSHCNSWCQVRFRESLGYVYGRYISMDPSYGPVYPRHYEVPPPFAYVPPPDNRAPVLPVPPVYVPPIYQPSPLYRLPGSYPPPFVYKPPPIPSEPEIQRPRPPRTWVAPPLWPRTDDPFRPQYRVWPHPE
jgi:hypothetical protein